MGKMASSSRVPASSSSRLPRAHLPSPAEEDTIAFSQSDEQLQRALTVSQAERARDAAGDREQQPEEDQKGIKGESMYVRIFEEMLSTVLAHEEHLFTPSELALFGRYRSLSYSARYLLVRLLLRKRGKWHRLDDLRTRYSHEIGNTVEVTVNDLCNGYVHHTATAGQADRAPLPTVTDPDLRAALRASLETYEIEERVRRHSSAPAAATTADVEVTSQTRTRSAKGKENAEEMPIVSFALPSTAASLPVLLGTLSVDELRTLAKQLKLKHMQPRSQLIAGLQAHSSSQSTLSFSSQSSGLVKDNATKVPARRQSMLSFSSFAKKSQEQRVRDMVLGVIRDAIQVDDAVVKLFARLNLIFFRSITPTPVLLPLILTSASRRTYPPYVATRTPRLFPSRSLLLDYEYALNLEGEINDLLEGEAGTNLSRLEIAAAVKKLALPAQEDWEALVGTMNADGTQEQRDSLQRFDPGHVLTRIVYKLAQSHGVLKEYDAEMATLKALLSQTRWRRGKRGAWYERLALILMTHCGGAEDVLQGAMEVVIRGLKDPMTHLVYRPSLERRLTRLEKKLCIPLDQRHSCDGKLRKPEVTIVEGLRIDIPDASAKNDRVSPVKIMKPAGKENAGQDVHQNRPTRPTGVKSVWEGREGQVSVEILALEWYEARGFRGFHSEGRILSMLFTLLFFDILFAPVAGAFETRYQTAPLDLSYDTFYTARKDAIEKRLEQIRNGDGPRIVSEVDDNERTKQTWCIGVRWDMFEKTDLLEIAQCLGGESLAVICRLLCEDYGQRGGGVPDLCIWNAKEGVAKFVEVKGPGDSLMESQKVWADVLLGAGVCMEVCKVVEKGQADISGTKSKRQPRKINTLSDSEEEDRQGIVKMEHGVKLTMKVKRRRPPSSTPMKRTATSMADAPAGGPPKKAKTLKA